MINYKDFQLTDRQIAAIKKKKVRTRIIRYIKKYGIEPESTEGFDVLSDKDIETYKKIYYSKYYQLIKGIKETIQKDYDKYTAEPGEVIYWESHIVLNKKLEDIVDIFEATPLTIENVFENLEAKKVIYSTTNFRTGKVTEIRENDEWYESHRIEPEEIVLDLGDALKIYWDSEARTTGDKVTIRRPINPTFEHPYYIIGQLDSPRIIFVDAITGEITYDK